MPADETLCGERTIDAIVSFHMLEHIEDLDRTLREMRRVLKPEGVMIHVMPSRALIVASIINQPIAYVKHAWMSAFGRRARLTGTGILGVLRRARITAKRLRISRSVWGPPHGTSSRARALFSWKRTAWVERLEQSGFFVEAIEGLPILYSLNKVLPFRLMGLRRGLAARGMPGSYAYVCRLQRGDRDSGSANSSVSNDVGQV